MKKSIPLLLFFAFGLAACGEKEEPQTETRLYRDGTYTAQFDTAGADGYGLYSYRWLFQNDQPVAGPEVEAITRVNQPK